MGARRALLTGATGFVGANLARRLLRDGHQVHLLVRRGHAAWRIADVSHDLVLHQADLRDEQAVAAAVGSIRPDWVFHLAAHGAYSYETDLGRIMKTNVLGTIHLVEACLETGFEAFVNTGSSSEYGFKDHPPAETEWLEPNSYYAVAKASATVYCRYVAQSRGVHLPTLRLYSVYGPWEEPARLIPTLILHGLRGGLPPLVHPDVARDFVHVDDVVDALLLAATRPQEEAGAVYNVGTGRQTTMREVVSAVRGLLDLKAEAHWGSMPDRHWDTSVWIADRRKITRALGWQPRHGFREGLRLTIDWFRKHPELIEHYETLGRRSP